MEKTSIQLDTRQILMLNAAQSMLDKCAIDDNAADTKQRNAELQWM